MSKVKFMYLNIWSMTENLQELLNDKMLEYARGEDYSEFFFLESNEELIKEKLKDLPLASIFIRDVKEYSHEK